jgi:hypothetical protein
LDPEWVGTEAKKGGHGSQVSAMPGLVLSLKKSVKALNLGEDLLYWRSPGLPFTPSVVFVEGVDVPLTKEPRRKEYGRLREI